MGASGGSTMAEDDEAVPQSNTEANKSAASMDKVTDHHQEKELKADASGISAELAALQAAEEAEALAARERARELAKVAVKDEDIALVAAEMNLTREEAEQFLRENEGDAKQTLTALVHM